RSGRSRTIQPTLTGTIHYMSPEQALGQEVDARSDIFSVGAVLYQMLASRRPFTADSFSEVIHQVIKATPTSLAIVAPNVPVAVQKVVNRCLEKRPEDRYATAAELYQDLKSAALSLSLDMKTDFNASAGSSFRETENGAQWAETIPDWRSH